MHTNVQVYTTFISSCIIRRAVHVYLYYVVCVFIKTIKYGKKLYKKNFTDIDTIFLLLLLFLFYPSYFILFFSLQNTFIVFNPGYSRPRYGESIFLLILCTLGWIFYKSTPHILPL